MVKIPKPIDWQKLREDEARVRKEFWPKLRRVISRIPFADKLLAAYYCASDANTPLSAKAMLMGALAYFIMPVDMVPDFIATLGFSDDATVLWAAYRAVKQHIRDEHIERAQQALADLRRPSASGPSGNDAGSNT